jgi:hypothetical protein
MWMFAARHCSRATLASRGGFGVSATTRSSATCGAADSRHNFTVCVCCRYVRNGAPHAGYRYCAEWGASKKHGRFSVTSNIDGHWGRVMGGHEVWECHGAVTHLQSSDCTDGPIWTADPHAMARAAPPPWDLKPGELVEVQLLKGSRDDCRLSAAERKGAWAHATVADDSISLILPKPSLPPSSKNANKAAGPEEVQVCAVRRPGCGPDLTRTGDMSAIPRVPDQKASGKKKTGAAGGVARPNVYMFGDRCVALRNHGAGAAAFKLGSCPRRHRNSHTSSDS